MANRFLTGTAAVLILAIGWFAWSGSCASAQEEKTESRLQAVLNVKGTFLPDMGGFKITEAPTSGPGANLMLPNAVNPTRGILQIGDVITEVDGKKFRDRREYLDLMNAAYAKNKSQVSITVKDAKTGRAVVWVSRPDAVRMDVPVAKLDFLAELGQPVPAAPAVPLVPATVDR
jgi:hypothetical protein